MKLAINEHLDKKVLIIATTVTVNGEKLHKLIMTLDASEKIELLPADRLVTLIEDENFLNNQEEINNYLRELIKPYNLNDYSHIISEMLEFKPDKIILGCTHFPLVKNNIENLLQEQNKDVKVIDGNEGIGKNLLQKIEERNNKENKLNIHIISTLNNSAFKKRVKEILGDIEYEYING